MRLQLGSSTANYKNQIIYAPYSATVLGFTTTTSQFNYVGSSGTDEAQAQFTLNSPFLTKYTKVTAQYANDAAFVNFGGIHTVNASYTAFTLLPSVGTLTGGTIRIYGYRN